MKNKSLIAVIVLLVVIISAALILYPKLSEKAKNEMETSSVSSQEETSKNTSSFEKYTNIKIYDNNGKEHMLSEFEGKPIILNFWATWCGFCIQEMPDFQKLYDENKDEVLFFMINTDDGITKGEKFIKNNNFTFPTYYDLEHDASLKYSIRGIPLTIAIDKYGNIVYNKASMIDENTLRNIINLIK